MLEKFRQAKMAEVENLRQNGVPRPYQGQRPDFMAALTGSPPMAVIAEFKRASPSRGVIRHDLGVEETAAQYAKSGAVAMSILTEEKFFHGNPAFLARARSADGNLPLLRKDFIFDPLQVEATAATPASALLLIARMLENASALRELREQAEKLGLAAVVEIFDAADLKLAREAGAKIIQVNARDLQTLGVDRKGCLDLIRKNPPDTGEVWIAASGMAKSEHLREAREAGFKAALIGTALMDQPSPGQALANLLRG